ncbi:dienelactone hydrolase family protein [Alcanivorax hongdengensis A-11-3]|uniref:Dienelactone hydrolase family protein n=1 Tax=Alcanivorax hongdengensis A-11-3 TaxID=1177179 RepID=L0WHR6_9GAMM|nr:dienelactone hydrolase family protein [Alcanivorax hongdengensis]EKF75702.1 dienelactone hydrolase family protein [Alcanivorax hongdengensis A-11-3]
MKQLLMWLVAGLLCASARAEVIETPVKLPDNLGSGYLYVNDDYDTPGQAVIVVHEWWGLNDYARSRARMLAEKGYVSLAVDMYGNGKVATHPKDAKAFMDAAMAEPDLMNARFDAARKLLLKQQQVNPKQIYAIGYCFGGGIVLQQARRGLDLAGVASFHGSLGTDHPAGPGDIKARILAAVGQDDPTIPADQVRGFVAEMLNAGVDVQLLSFPGVKHAFTNPKADELGKRFSLPLAYDAHADQASWAALLAFIGPRKR